MIGCVLELMDLEQFDGFVLFLNEFLLLSQFCTSH